MMSIVSGLLFGATLYIVYCLRYSCCTAKLLSSSPSEF